MPRDVVLRAIDGRGREMTPEEILTKLQLTYGGDPNKVVTLEGNLLVITSRRTGDTLRFKVGGSA